MGWSCHHSGLSFPERKKAHIGGSQGNTGRWGELRGWPEKRRLLPSSKRHSVAAAQSIPVSVGLAWYLIP